MRVGHGIARDHTINMPALGLIGFEELEPRWHAGKQMLDGHGAARVTPNPLMRDHAAVVDAHHRASGFVFMARHTSHDADRCNTGQRLATKPKRINVFEVLS